MPDPLDYTVGWICALSTEAVAAAECLDEEHGRLDQIAHSDNNTYIVGSICGHNVVIAVLPDGEYGITSAGNVANDMLYSFPNIRIGLMVGIGGGAPNAQNDLRLGDVVVSNSQGNKHGGVFQYDFGKEIQDENFHPTGILNRPPFVLRTAVTKLKVDHERKGNKIDEEIQRILCKNTRLQKRYKRPNVSSDKLYQSHVLHPTGDATCNTCGDHRGNLVIRADREEGDDNPVVHYGLIASANRLMKNANTRDRLSEEEGVLCFEMEAAGLMNTFPCLVIRGICDYSDTHKNKDWQGYAAMTAAAYAKGLLSIMIPNMVQEEKKISVVLGNINENIAAIRNRVDEACGIQQSDGDQKVLDWLTPLEFGLQHSDFLEKRQLGTCKWFLESERYQTWLAKDKQQTLFCPGIPGAGKTILTSVLIEHLKQRFRSDPQVGIAYIYCDFRRQGEQGASQLVASLLKQLVRGQANLPEPVLSLYRNHKKGVTRPSLEEFTGVLLLVAAKYDRVFVTIDALDECQTDGNCRSRFLTAIFDLQAKTEKVSIFATSRWIPEIEEKFKSYPSQEIQANREDVSRYIEGRMDDFPTCVKGDLDLQKDIRTRVIECIDGMFLLAQLHIRSLASRTNRRDIREDLEKLPSGEQAYKIAYDNAMERIEGQGQDQQRLAKQALSWISHARRQLTSIELQHALAARSGDSELIEDGITSIQDLISWCAGLVTVDGNSGITRLVHHTTQQYFDLTKARWFSDAETKITEACTTYLSFNVFETGICETDFDLKERLRSYPFYKYAACGATTGRDLRPQSKTP